MKKILAIIPARFESTRFPGKPLALLGGISMVEQVYRKVKSCIEITEALVATDDTRIQETVLRFGGKVMLTSGNCATGTDRCAEAFQKLGGEWDLVVNVQGDEPFIKPEQISEIIHCMEKEGADIGTLVKKITDSSDLVNPNVVKVVLSSKGKALYFSRNCVPFVRDAEKSDWMEHSEFYRHLGMYAFRAKLLPILSSLPVGMLEKAENLEQLRWLEAGYSIFAGTTEHQSIGIDTPEDLEMARKMLMAG